MTADDTTTGTRAQGWYPDPSGRAEVRYFDGQAWPGGRRVGSIRAENWRAWNFSITDEAGDEVARITKTWEGLAKTLLTTADNYVVEITRPVEEPLRSLVVAAALGVDTALKQDARGLGLSDLTDLAF